MKTAIVLAAGMGTRMKSSVPKVLHKVNGKEMIIHVLDALDGANVDNKICVLGHGIDEVTKVIGDRAVVAKQEKMLGTGDAVISGMKAVDPSVNGSVFVLCGDTPLITGETLSALYDYHEKNNAKATILTCIMDNPFGYGRIIRDEKTGSVIKIVEQKDATEEEKKVCEINSGTYIFDKSALEAGLKTLKPANAQGEYYLTDVISYLTNNNEKVCALATTDSREVMGVNDKVALELASSYKRAEINKKHMLNGVTIIDSLSTYIEDGVTIDSDAVIYPGCILEGNTHIETGAVIGPNTRILNSTVGENAKVINSTVDGCEIGAECNIGPYTYLRPGCKLGKKVKVGGFCEAKKLVADEGTKVPHLSYMGDVTIGKNVNIGAGTITCNYDGKNKFPTVIGDDVFVGSNSNLVAPVNLGDGAFIAAGSTITKDVPATNLGVARARQQNIDHWLPQYKRNK